MMTRRESSNERDDVPLHIVGHRLQKVDAPERASHSQGEARSAAPRSGSATGAPARAQGVRGRNTVLRQVVLVDREIDSLRDIAIALRDEYDFHITISGTEALNLLRHGDIDTIVVGQTLYSSTGLNVLAEARRHAPSTHRVLLANAVESSSVERGAAAVAPFRVMQRPCTADKLRELLEAHEDLLQTIDAQQAQVRIQPSEEFKPPTNTHDPADFEHVVLESPPDLPRRKHKSRNDVDPQAVAALPIVVYTDNAEFYQAISQALIERHDVRLCTQLERAAEFAELGQCPLLITDRPATQVELHRISISLRSLDPGMLTIAAGPPETSSALRKLLGTEALHSFLPTPINAALVRLVVESAKRQYLINKQSHSAEPELKAAPAGNPFNTRPAVTPYFVPNYRNDYSVDDLDESAWRRALPRVAAGFVAVAILAAGGWYGWQRYEEYAAAKAAQAAAPDGDIALAKAAFDAGLYASPSDSSALHYFGEALKKAPDNAEANAGLDRTVERVIEQAESALLKEQLDAAADAIEAVRTAQPQNKRLSFLESQLEKERGKATATRNARTQSAPAPAADATTDEMRTGPINNETQRRQAVNRWLSSARARIQQDKLVAPENDNAEFFLRQAERADPDNEAVRQSLREVGSRLLASAREAVARQQLDQARKRLADAGRFGVDVDAAERLRVDIETAASSTARSGFQRLALQRIRDNRLFEPDRDSAKYYLGQLERIDPDAQETRQVAQSFALRLIENANQAIDQQQLNAAVQLLNETRRLGFAGPELTAADNRLRSARNPAPATQATMQRVTSAPPKPTRVVAPKFPDEAMRNGIQGWVDVSFRILPSGDVADVVALASSPGRYAAQFERAAVAALAQYKYEPRTADTPPLSMVQKVQFKLGNR
jgi:protein TonB